MGFVTLIPYKPTSSRERLRIKSTPKWEFLIGISGRKGTDLRLVWRGRDAEGTPVDVYINEGAWWEFLPDNLEAKKELGRLAGVPYPYKLRGNALLLIGLSDMVDR